MLIFHTVLSMMLFHGKLNIRKQVWDEQRCVLDEIGWGRGWGQGWGRGWGRGLIAHLLWTIEDDYQAHFSRIHCLKKSGYRRTDQPTDQRTDGPTDRQSLLKRCVDACKNLRLLFIFVVGLQIENKTIKNEYWKFGNGSDLHRFQVVWVIST